MSSELCKPLIVSMCGPIMNKVKTCMGYAKKNRKLSEKLSSTVNLLGEQLLPAYCASNKDDYEKINSMHNLFFLLANKAQQVFTSHVIHTIIDQNWDLKGFKMVMARIFKLMNITVTEGFTKCIDEHIKLQNHQSSSCIKAIGQFIRNPKKTVNDDDITNPTSVYECEADFVKEDINRFRQQRIKYECFQVLHPWAYDLDNVDFKYILNNDLADKICRQLTTQSAQVFWLTFFKSQSAVSADDFFTALREVCLINKVPEFYESNMASYHQKSSECDYMLSLDNMSNEIMQYVQQAVDAGASQEFNSLRDQVKTYQGDFSGDVLIDANTSIDHAPALQAFQDDKDLACMKMFELSAAHNAKDSCLERKPFECTTNQVASHKLNLSFESVDTEELKGLNFSFDGDSGIYKVGEGEANHYQIPNDKKLWESQFMIVCKDGKYFIRDMGVVHTSRVKVDKTTEIQLQSDMLVDLGKVVHYQFDKVTHSTMPTQRPSQNFQILRPSDEDYTVEMDENDPPTLRARPTWVSSDENKDLIQKEIILEADAGHMYHTIGRSMKRMVQIKLKAVSADHAKIGYNPEKGWFITEQGKDKLSSNGTFVFMKSLGQIAEHQPSDLIPLHDGMVISFINYELRVNLEKKDESEVKQQEATMNSKHQAMMSASQKMGETMAAATPVEIKQEEVVEVQPEVEEKEEVVMAEEKPESPRAATPEAQEEAPVEGEGQVPEEPQKEEVEQEAEPEKQEEPAAVEEAAQEQVEEKPAEPEQVEEKQEEVVEQTQEQEQQEEVAAEEPKAEEPVAEEPKAEEPVAEEPKAEEPAAVEESAPVEEPAQEEKVEEPEAQAEEQQPEAQQEEASAEQPAESQEVEAESAPVEEPAQEQVEEKQAEPEVEEKKDEPEAVAEPEAQETGEQEAEVKESVEEPAKEETNEVEAAAEEKPAEEEQAETQEVAAEEPPKVEEEAAPEQKEEQAPATNEQPEAEEEKKVEEVQPEATESAPANEEPAAATEEQNAEPAAEEKEETAEVAATQDKPEATEEKAEEKPAESEEKPAEGENDKKNEE